MKKLLALILFSAMAVNINVMNAKKIIVAHRGGAFLGPENTLSCISKGMETGAEWIEIDVHLSADGKIVVCHDETVDRTTNGTGLISRMTYDHIQALNVVDSEGTVTGEHIPLLEEVLELIKGKAKLLLEIKRSRNSLPGIEKACLDCIKSHGMLDQVVFQSFDDEVIETVHKLCPEMRVEKLITIPFFINFRKYDYAASINPCYKFTTRSFIRRAHKHGKEVKVWTLNKYKESLVEEADGIITNDPGLFL